MEASRDGATQLFVIGAGGLASEVIDAYKLSEPEGDIEVFATPTPEPAMLAYEYWRGAVAELDNQIHGCRFVVAIGDSRVRMSIFKHLEALGGIPYSVIHPQSVIGSGNKVGSGSIMLAGSSITVNVQVGEGCVLNPGSRISHDCVIGDFVTFGPNAVAAGKSLIGSGSLIGAGSIINPGISVAPFVILGSGSVAHRDLNVSGTWAGSPAKLLDE
jgi:sugar O-acyltransferase (sialic acid O-acetyltransferase NeuD family)